jgi:LacI family transcriptional regulator
MAMQLLINAGHRNIFCISGPSVSITTKERLRGCQAAIKESGMDINFASRGNEFSSRNGYVETQLLLSGLNRPTAIFALSNTILLGSLEALREKNVKVPDEMSIVSFDDNIYMDYLSPAITRVVQPINNIGMAAVKLLLQSIESKSKPDGHILMNPTIIHRDSVAPPKEA